MHLPQEGEKNMKKSCRWMALLLSGLMLLSACSKSEETTKKKKKTTKKTTTEETETDETDETDEPTDTTTEDAPVPTTNKDTEPDSSTTLASLTTPGVGTTTSGLPATSTDPKDSSAAPTGVSPQSQKVRAVLEQHGFTIFDDEDDWCNETFGAYVEEEDGSGVAVMFDDYIDQEEAQEYFNDSVEETQEAKNTGELIGTVEVNGNRMTLQGYEKGNEDDELYGVMILDGNIIIAVTAFGATDDTKALADQILKECGY